MNEVLVNRLGGLSLPGKSVVRLTDRPDMTLDVYRGRKTTIQEQQHQKLSGLVSSTSYAQMVFCFAFRMFYMSAQYVCLRNCADSSSGCLLTPQNIT